MSETMDISDEIRNIFCKYREKQKCELLGTLNDVKCCECGHQTRIRNANNKLSFCKKMTLLYQIILGIVIFLLLLALYALWAARRYNRTRLYGSGACTSTILWTFDSCLVVS